MSKKQIVWTVSLLATYAMSCWAWYESGKCTGAIEAYNDCCGELSKADEQLREKYPEAFEG